MSFFRQQWLGSLLLVALVAGFAIVSGRPPAADPDAAPRDPYPRFRVAAEPPPLPNPEPAVAPRPDGRVCELPGGDVFRPARPAPARRVFAQDPTPKAGPKPAEPAPEPKPEAKPLDAAGPPLGTQELLRAEPPLPRTEHTVFVTQYDCIELALENNTDIAVGRFDPELNHYDIAGAYGVFDPTFFGQTVYNDDARQTGSTLSGASILNRDTTTFATGFRGLLETGATWETSLSTIREVSNSSFSGINPQWTTTTGFTLRQPLLKNFGIPYNKRNIHIARKTKEISLEHFTATVLKTVFSVQEAYFNLVFALRDKEVKEKSLKLAEKLLEVNHNKVKVGALAPIEELQAETKVATEQEGIIQAEKTIDDAEDVLKRLVRNDSGPLADWDIHLYPTDQPIYSPMEPNLEDQLRLAMEKRPELREFKFEKEISDIQIAAKKNDLLPSVDLQWKYNYDGLGNTVDRSYHNVGASDYKNYEIGAFVEYPLGNRTAQNALKRAEAERRRIVVQQRGVEQSIVAEVREAVRAIGTTARQISATAKASELARKQLEADEKRMELGLSTSFQVLQFQEDLAQAERNETRAVIDHMLARLRLLRANGTLLEEMGVRLR